MSGLILPQGYRRRQGGFILPGMFGGLKGAGGGGGGGNRTIVKLSSDIATGSLNGNSPYKVPWPTPVVDGLSAYSAGNPTRLTVPTTGDYIAYACSASTGGTSSLSMCAVEIIVNNARSYSGWACNHIASRSDSTATLASRTCQTPILHLTAGDYVEMTFMLTNGYNLSASSTAPTLFMLYKLPSRNAALAYLNAADTLVNGSNVVPFDAETYDDGSIWSSGAATDFLIPSGISRASMTCSGFTLDGTANTLDPRGWRVLKNGAERACDFNILGSVVDFDGGNNDSAINLYSGPIDVTTGDVLTAEWRNTDTSYTRSAFTSAGVELHARQSCSVTLSAALTAIDADTSPPYYVPWTSETFDDASLWTSGSATRITSPGGWIQVGSHLTLSSVSTSAGVYYYIEHYNSSDVLIAKYGNSYRLNGATPSVSALTPHINSTAGDYFRCALEVVGDTSITINTTSRFWAELYAA